MLRLLKQRAAPVASILVMFALGGCASSLPSGEPLANLPPASIPRYTEGETLIYANRRSEQVVATRNGRTLWQDQRGYRLTRDDNFIVPILSRDSSRGVYTHRLIQGDPNELWPLGQGNEVYFRMLYLRPDMREYTQFWHCEDLGGRRLQQHQRRYDTYLVRCIRSYENSSYARVRSEQVDYYYDPELQLVVRRDSIDLRNRREPRQMKLWAYLRPQDASAEQIASIRDQLKQLNEASP
ncbi:hypothetical protein [Motiliproteus sediminis]|uniref:hypothetical protein n=1 Tax=Motiliproteus sediminis TaxID=1468178 RepID=UPI001AF0208F|nr:hypothetical protein [Motiliproteus sediminis]